MRRNAKSRRLDLCVADATGAYLNPVEQQYPGVKQDNHPDPAIAAAEPERDGDGAAAEPMQLRRRS